DFKFYYDAKFGRKKAEKNGETAGEPVVSNGVSLGIVSNGNPHAKKASEMAVYEQFRTEGQNQIHSNGFSPVNMDDRPYDFLNHHVVLLDSVVGTCSLKNVKSQLYQKQIRCLSLLIE
ncbi:hypothetical protein V8G54_003257, partial [Vigna mungo]